MILSVKDIKSVYSPKIDYNQFNISLADKALSAMWEERLRKRGDPIFGDRSGSCKFAALFARNLFGGKLAGNANHVFVIKDSKIIDLNDRQTDVIILGDKAHSQFNSLLCHIEYREAFTSCLERLKKYEELVLNQAI